jgi:dTDP-4-dehydrorhamnose 3,5-epimerase
MKVERLALDGAYRIHAQSFKDQRGVFGVGWESEAWVDQGISFSPTSACHVRNTLKNTLRGMHYQCDPFAQTKIVTCLQGTIFDVIVDLRRNSDSFLAWEGQLLSEDDGISIYVPKGFAHGYLTLKDETIVTYLIDGQYNPVHARVVRWNDPLVKIQWPSCVPFLSERDKNEPDFVL